MVAAADEAVANLLRGRGWNVLTRGWPDLLAVKDSNVMAIELKRGNDRLRPEQVEMAGVFVDVLGVPFHVARDSDVEGLMRKKGRVMLPGRSISGLQFELERAKSDVRAAQYRLDNLARAITETTEIFGRYSGTASPQAQASKTIGRALGLYADESDDQVRQSLGSIVLGGGAA